MNIMAEIIIDENENLNVSESKINQENRLNYLLKQAEVYSHFVTNGSKAKKILPGKRKFVSTLVRSDSKRGSPANGQGDHVNDYHEIEKVKMQFNETPEYIQLEMRDYQIRGLNWLISLYENGINGILADEMGLGKTLQTISMLGYLKHFEHDNGPHLIVVPNSTLQNWLNEIEKFCPTLRTQKIIGNKMSRLDLLRNMKATRSKWDICVTTYEMILMEKGLFSKFQWHYIVVDEAHRLKNENTKLSQILRTFLSKNRLLLTGTPLQNNLHELWALLNFILPDVFSAADDFDTWFDSDDCLSGNEDIVKRLHTILKPFLLRRVKAEVEKSLLPKIEVKLYVGMTEIQRNAYKAILMKDLKTIMADQLAPKRALNSIMMELRKVANHPYLIRGIEPEPFTTAEHLITNCGKMMLLDKLLVKLKAQKSRVLIFSQFVIMLNILDDYLGFRGYEYRRLEGNTPTEKRASDIDEFNAPDSNIFAYLISTRAGGLGINLATADAVIIYDSDWNPQSDVQAIDRAHRIGQKKQVRVFRLVTENTVDERIVNRAEIKLRLDHMVVQQGRIADKKSKQLLEDAGGKRDIIRFGMDKIMSSQNSNLIDVDIDAVFEKSTEKTDKENKKFNEMGESQLRNFTLEEASSESLYQFEGVDFRTLHNKNKNEAAVIAGRSKRALRTYKTPKMYEFDDQEESTDCIRIHDFQLYPEDLYDLADDNDCIDISINVSNKKRLMKIGFPEWTKQDFELYCDGLVEFGQFNIVKIAENVPSKSFDEVRRYHTVFWSYGRKCVKNFNEIVKKIKKPVQDGANRSNLSNSMFQSSDRPGPSMVDLLTNRTADKSFEPKNDENEGSTNDNSIDEDGYDSE